MKPKTIIFLGDGMADEPLAALGGQTPLQAAHTPAMDSIARDGVSGTLFTLPDPFPTSSEVANMSVLGCDLASEYCGRGPIEAAGRNISLGPEDLAFRVNLTTVVDGVLRDFSGGHIDPESAARLIDVLNRAFATDAVRFHPGVSYRNILVLSGAEYSSDLATDKPDDNQGERVDDHLPRAKNPSADVTASLLRRLIAEAPAVLEADDFNRKQAATGQPMANGIWPWNGGKAANLRRLRDKYGISSAVISAVDVIMGLGRLLGMDVIEVPGATGYIDTNYEGKADAAVAALDTHDFVYVHVEAIDEVSHAQDLEKKIQAIEDFDARVVARALAALPASVHVAVLPDHPVPLALGKHTRTPVPLSVRMAGRSPDTVTAYSEIDCPRGTLGDLKADGLMNVLFG